MFSQIRKSDTIEDYKKGGKIKAKQKQKQRQVVNIKNVINVERRVRRSNKLKKSKPTPPLAPPVQLHTYNRFFQPSSDQNYKSLTMGNNIPSADNINAVSNRVANLILGRMRNNINNANSGLVIPSNFSSEQALTISNNTPAPIIEEVEEKKTPIQMNVRRPDEFDVEVKIPDLESMGRDYINFPDTMNDRLASGIIKEEEEEEEDELPPYQPSSASAPPSRDISTDQERLIKMTVKDLYKEANQLGIQYNITTPDKKIKLKKNEVIAEIMNKRHGRSSSTSSSRSTYGLG